jgi:hypothetical protein
VIKYVLSIDPGLSTGISLLSYNDTSFPVLEGRWQFPGGITGFLRWYRDHHYFPDGLGNTSLVSDDIQIIGEKFTARATSGFSYRTDALEPLRVEGAMIALGLMPDYDKSEARWLDPGLQYVAGGTGKADKKKRQHKLLKDLGLYVTGKDVGCPDADDVRSSLGHALGWLIRVQKHQPTYLAVSKWIEENS